MRPAGSRTLAARAAAAIAVLLLSRAALADPQGTAALTIGVAGVGADRAFWQDTAFHLGGRGDVLFGRSGPYELGLGPYAEVQTQGFDDLQLGGGASLLVPVVDYLPLVFSAGAYGRAADGSVEPGVTGQVFWGSRSYNYHSAYGMSAGLSLQLRAGLGDQGATSVVAAAHLDLVAMSLPFVFLLTAVRGTGDEAAPVR
jgi:hypothetical protein